MSDAVAQPSDLELVRSSYDRVADNYVAMEVGDLSSMPWLRAALAAFAENVRGLGPVLDVGCGPGIVTAHLADLGVDASGVDLSPQMIAHARRLHPGLPFTVASATDLRLEDASLGGVPVSWTTHLWRPEELLALLADAGVDPVAELRLPADLSGHPQVLLAARRPG